MYTPKTKWIDLGDKFKGEGPLGYGIIPKILNNLKIDYSIKRTYIYHVQHEFFVYDLENNLVRSDKANTYHGARLGVAKLVNGYDPRATKVNRNKYSETKATNKAPALSLTALDSKLILDAINNNAAATRELRDVLDALLERLKPKPAIS